MKTSRIILLCACIAGCTAVILGAFGAHGLRPHLTPPSLAIFETGVRYQMYHGLALLAVAWLATQRNNKLPGVAAALWCIGILFFSGSLYLLATHSLLGITLPIRFPLLTPLGGLFLITGWITLLVAAIKQ